MIDLASVLFQFRTARTQQLQDFRSEIQTENLLQSFIPVANENRSEEYLISHYSSLLNDQEISLLGDCYGCEILNLLERSVYVVAAIRFIISIYS